MQGALQHVHAVIGPDSPHLAWWQACVRAVLIFVVGIAYIRAVGPRTFARGSPLDIVISVVIGSNLSRALTGSAAFLPTLAATAVLAALHWLFAFTTRKVPALGRLVKGEPVVLVEDGRVDEAELARQNISRGDLEEELRLKSAADPGEVRRATLERSGQVSVLKAR
jgi:uncharacterized membrane protein YcaP (DUF421 family)